MTSIVAPNKGPEIRVQGCCTFKAHMRVQNEIYARFLYPCCQIMELLYLQGHAKVRHWHRIPINCRYQRALPWITLDFCRSQWPKSCA